LLVGFVSCEMVLSYLKSILMPVCLKMLVIFLICGDEKVEVAHFVCLLRGVGGGVLSGRCFVVS
jgi:hypothetical protein